MPVTTRFAPICLPTMGRAVIRATGIPPLSISFTIVAPLRLSVPQVETIRTPLIPAVLISATISLPIRVMFGIEALHPLVV